jgi:hypothetical protein
MGEIRNAHKILFGKPEGMIPRRRHRCRWKYNIKLDLKEITCGLDSSGWEQDPVTGFNKHGNEPSGFFKGGNFLPSKPFRDVKCAMPMASALILIHLASQVAPKTLFTKCASCNWLFGRDCNEVVVGEDRSPLGHSCCSGSRYMCSTPLWPVPQFMMTYIIQRPWNRLGNPSRDLAAVPCPQS